MEEYEIPMPTDGEREAAVREISRQACMLRRPRIRIPLRTLFFGTGDCLAVAAAVTGVCFVAGLLWVHADKTAPLVFLLSPMLYGTFCALSEWKEDQNGILEWRRTCRVSGNVLTGERMLVVGALCVLVVVPLDLLLWRRLPDHFDFFWLAGLSFACLCLYALLVLWALRFRRGILIASAVWCGIGVGLVLSGAAASVLLAVPALFWYVIAVAALAVFLLQVRRMYFSMRPVSEAFDAAN